MTTRPIDQMTNRPNDQPTNRPNDQPTNRPTDQPTNRQPSWRVFRRCLAIIRRVQRGPTDRAGLIEAVYAQEGPDAYGEAQGQVLANKVYKDLARIRQELQIELVFDRRLGGYIIRRTRHPWLGLPEADLQTIAWLAQTFDAKSPRHLEINAFLHRIQSLLSPAQQDQIDRHRATPSLDLGRRDDNHIPPQIRSRLTKALIEGRRIEFDYLSTTSQDTLPRRHVVDPYEEYFEAGHYYLKGWCHYSVSAAYGRQEQGRYFPYRLDRVRELHLLSNRVPPPPKATTCRVIYKLSEPLVRRGISRQRWIDFEPAGVTIQPNGSAIIHGQTDNEFFALQSLIRYGPGCEILGEPRLRRMMAERVKQMAELYLGEIGG